MSIIEHIQAMLCQFTIRRIFFLPCLEKLCFKRAMAA